MRPPFVLMPLFQFHRKPQTVVVFPFDASLEDRHVFIGLDCRYANLGIGIDRLVDAMSGAALAAVAGSRKNTGAAPSLDCYNSSSQ